MREILVNIEKEICKGCSYCIQVCPEKVLQLSEFLNRMGYNFSMPTKIQKCTGCRFCAIICPEVAIEIEVVDHDRGKM